MSQLKWNTNLDLCLLQAMVGLRPVGIHKHFRMCNIYQRFLQKAPEDDYYTNDLWERIKDWYNLDVLEELEYDSDSEVSVIEDQEAQKNQEKNTAKQKLVYTLVKPEELDFWREESEFFLPWDEYGTMILERAGEGVEDDIESPYVENLSQDQPSSKYSTPEPIAQDVQDDSKKPTVVEPVSKKKGKPTSIPVSVSETTPVSTPAPESVSTSAPTAPSTSTNKRKKSARQLASSKKSKKR